MDIKKYNINDLKKQLDIPEQGQFLGYIVHLPETDEFLNHYSEDETGIIKLIAKLPHLALTFNDINEAIHASKAFNYKARVCLLFDIGSQYLVIGDEEIGNSL